MDYTSGVGLAVVIFLVVLAILWFLLPFAVFGIKDKLTALVTETKNTNSQLSELKSEIVKLNSGQQTKD